LIIDHDIQQIDPYQGWGANCKITSIDHDDADAMDEVIEAGEDELGLDDIDAVDEGDDAMDEVIEIDGDEVALGDMDAVDEEDEIIGTGEDEMACVHLTLITWTRLSLKVKAILLLTMRRTKLLLMTRRIESLS
jgi:hypothetical protein